MNTEVRRPCAARSWDTCTFEVSLARPTFAASAICHVRVLVVPASSPLLLIGSTVTVAIRPLLSGSTSNIVNIQCCQSPIFAVPGFYLRYHSVAICIETVVTRREGVVPLDRSRTQSALSERNVTVQPLRKHVTQCPLLFAFT